MGNDETTVPDWAGRIREARLRLGLDRRRDVKPIDVARALGVVGSTVSRWESGEKEPDFDTVRRLAAFLRVAPGWIAFGPDAMEVPGDDHGKNGGASILLEPVEQPRPSTPEELARAERAAAEELARMRAAEASTKKTPKRRASGS